MFNFFALCAPVTSSATFTLVRAVLLDAEASSIPLDIQQRKPPRRCHPHGFIIYGGEPVWSEAVAASPRPVCLHFWLMRLLQVSPGVIFFLLPFKHVGFETNKIKQKNESRILMFS